MDIKNEFGTLSNLKQSISAYEDYCDGYGNNHVTGNSYVLGLVVATSSVPQKLSSSGSMVLDYINAFDKAEVAGTNIGKINATSVSSFCGPQGLILGYHILKTDIFESFRIKLKNYSDKKIYSLDPLLISTEALIGSIDHPVFPIIPGAHVPCAGKHIENEGPCTLYAGIAIGVSNSNNTLNQYALLMEDAGFVKDSSREDIIDKLIQSVIDVGINQKTNYETIFVGIKQIDVKPGNVGCALVLAPYLLLPKNAVGKFENFCTFTLEQWKQSLNL